MLYVKGLLVYDCNIFQCKRNYVATGYFNSMLCIGLLAVGITYYVHICAKSELLCKDHLVNNDYQ